VVCTGRTRPRDGSFLRYRWVRAAATASNRAAAVTSSAGSAAGSRAGGAGTSRTHARRSARSRKLRAWRGDQARSQQVPAYVVLHNSHLEEIARRKPKSVHELGSIKGVGLRRAARYGDELLALVRGEEQVPAAESDGLDYRQHLEAAERLLSTGSGAAAVSELARALEIGGEEAKSAVDALLSP